jgi:hypothetical protein
MTVAQLPEEPNRNPQPIPQEMQRRVQLWRGQNTNQGIKYANAIIKEWKV